MRCVGVRFDRLCSVLVHVRTQLVEPPLDVEADAVGARCGQGLAVCAGGGAGAAGSAQDVRSYGGNLGSITESEVLGGVLQRGETGFRPVSHADGDHSIHRDHRRCSGVQ